MGHPSQFEFGKTFLALIDFFSQVDEDEPLFLSLINDLFPGIQLDNATYADLQVALSHQIDQAGLVNHPAWNLKVVQVKPAFY